MTLLSDSHADPNSRSAKLERSLQRVDIARGALAEAAAKPPAHSSVIAASLEPLRAEIEACIEAGLSHARIAHLLVIKGSPFSEGALRNMLGRLFRAPSSKAASRRHRRRIGGASGYASIAAPSPSAVHDGAQASLIPSRPATARAASRNDEEV